MSLAAVVAAACSSARYGAQETGQPSVILPAHFAEGKPHGDGGAEADREGQGPAPDASVASPAAESRHSAQPDPTPLEVQRHWEYMFRYSQGRVVVASVRPLLFDSPIAAPRHMGRFAVELWIGRELIERIRFDFPLLGAEVPAPEGEPRPLREPPKFGPGADVERRVLVPASSRATRAVLVDRATGTVTPLPWPPDSPLAGPKQDGARGDGRDGGPRNRGRAP